MHKQPTSNRISQLKELEPETEPQKAVVIAIFRGRLGLLNIRQDWKEITDRMLGRRHYFHLWEWHRDYLETLVDDPDEAFFLVAYRAKIPMAVLPLCSSTMKQNWCELKILKLPHHKHMSLSDMICDPSPEHADIPGHLIEHLRSSMRTGWDMLLMRGILAESSTMSRWWAAVPRPRIQLVQDRCDTLSCVAYDELLGNVSKNFRNNLRKARNKLAKLPETKFDFVREPALLPEAFSHFIRVEASGWKGDKGTGTAIGLHEQLRSFYGKLMNSFGATGSCQINLLRVGDECIAGQFCLRLDATLYILKIGYSENHSHLAPGNMLLEECIRQSLMDVDPIQNWNLISGVSWHNDWKPSHEAVCDLWIYNRTLRGLVLYGWGAGVRLCRSIFRELRKRPTIVGVRNQCATAGAV